MDSMDLPWILWIYREIHVFCVFLLVYHGFLIGFLRFSIELAPFMDLSSVDFSCYISRSLCFSVMCF